jgi:phage gp36-like protein
MAYCTQDDLLKMIPLTELAELTAESGDDPDPDVVDEAIEKADAEIDSYLGARYAVPLSPVPARVKGLSVDLAIFHLYSRRSVAPEVRQQRYEAALGFLERVAAGQLALEGSGGEPLEAGGEVEEFSGNPRTFSRNTLGEW